MVGAIWTVTLTFARDHFQPEIVSETEREQKCVKELEKKK